MEKSNIKKKILKTIVSLVIVTSLIVSSIIPSYALKWNGDSSTGGGGTGATENGFAVPSTNNNECCVGYRFSVVNNNGDLRANLVIDIFKNTSLGNDAFNYYYKCTKKYNKIEIIQRNYLDFESVPTQYNCFMEQNMGFANILPNPSELEGWQKDDNNLNPILRTAFDNDRANIGTLVNGDKILVEPLFAVKLEQQYHALTVTEIAIYGAKTLGYDSDGGSPSTGANGKYLSFISNKTNREFANMLHIPYDLNDNGNQKIWTKVEFLREKVLL